MTTQEEVTTIENSSPSQVVKTTTLQTEPQVKGEAPQKVYEKKKSILRLNQIIWYILGFIEVLLIFRIVLKALGANQYSGFTNLIYTITAPFAIPFAGIVYICIAWGFIYLLEIVYPITPKDLEIE